jgi:CubicO group peptidase (beta-lactamase class C family)
MTANGFSDKKFYKLKDAYEQNFKEGLDVGSSLGVTYNGKVILNLWDGFKDEEKKEPWLEDTIVNVWSSTKNMASLCAYILYEKGLLDFHAPVKDYWPEFSENGKENILVSHIMSHSSGLSGWDSKIDYRDYYNWDKLCMLLAKQKPFWEAGKEVGYHSISVGYLIGEIVKRISGKTIGQFFQDEIAKPLNSDFHIGLDPMDFNRVANIYMPGDPSTEDLFDEMDKESPAYKTMANGILKPSCALEEDWRISEIPAAGGTWQW